MPMRTLLGLIGLVLGLAGSAAAQDKVSFRLDWTVFGVHAPYFLALDQGYYKQENLDVKISEGQGSATVVKLIAQGTDPIGLVDYGVMAKGVAQGLPVKAVWGMTQNNPIIIISHADNPVKTPKDLVGKMIAFAPAESSAQLFPGLLAAAGVDRNQINIVNPAFAAKIALFRQKRVDAITGALNLQVPQLEAEGYKVHYFRYADYGVNNLTIGVVVNTAFLTSNPDVVKRFLRATTRGWTEAQKSPEKAVEAIFKSYPQYREQKAVMIRQLELSIPDLQTPNTKGKPLGWMAREDWERTQEMLVKYMGLEKPMAVQEYYTNDFIP
jgi:NitT/TauT family transport system substrate-binding protein